MYITLFSIQQKWPNFRIEYFCHSKCRPLHSAARGRCPPPFTPFPPPLVWKCISCLGLIGFHIHNQCVLALTSSPAFTSPAVWCRDFHFQSRVFSSPIENQRFARGGSVSAKFSCRRRHPPPIIFARIDRPVNALQLCR